LLFRVLDDLSKSRMKTQPLLCDSSAGLNPGSVVPFCTPRAVANSDSLRFDIVDHVMLIVHADVPPSESDWARMIVVRNAHGDRIRGNLVVAPPRASINASQRADVAQFMRDTGTSVAVVTDSALIRGLARAVGFLGLQVRAFAFSELASAFNYLVVPQSRHADMSRRIDAMQAQLAGSARNAFQ
jgi:hypothetical protein